MLTDNNENQNKPNSNWINYNHNHDKVSSFDLSMLVDIELSIRKDLKILYKKNNNESELKRLMKIDGEFMDSSRNKV